MVGEPSAPHAAGTSPGPTYAPVVQLPPDLVVFDCDGVLVDSERLSVRLEVVLLAELGWEITEAEIVERFVGRSDGEMQRAVVEQTGRPLPDGWDAMATARYRAAFEAELEAVPGVAGAIERLRAAGVAMCVASSGSHDKMALTLGRTGLAPHFTGRIFSATEVAAGKPAPDLFLHAASTMGVHPARCVVVEDSRPGVDAALAAGMRPVAYGGGVTPPERLAGEGVHVITDMTELPRVLGID